MTSSSRIDHYPKGTKWVKLEFPFEEFVRVFGAASGSLIQRQMLLKEHKITTDVDYWQKENNILESACNYMRLAVKSQLDHDV